MSWIPVPRALQRTLRSEASSSPPPSPSPTLVSHSHQHSPLAMRCLPALHPPTAFCFSLMRLRTWSNSFTAPWFRYPSVFTSALRSLPLGDFPHHSFKWPCLRRPATSAMSNSHPKSSAGCYTQFPRFHPCPSFNGLCRLLL